MIASLERLLSAADHQNELANTLLQATLLQSGKQSPQPLSIQAHDYDYDVRRPGELHVEDKGSGKDKTVHDADGAVMTTNTIANAADVTRMLLRTGDKHHEDLVRYFNTQPKRNIYARHMYTPPPVLFAHSPSQHTFIHPQTFSTHLLPQSG